MLSLPARSNNFAVTEYEPSTRAVVEQTNEPADEPFDVVQTDPVATPPMYNCANVSFGASATNDGVEEAEMKSESHQVGRHVSDPAIAPDTVGAVTSTVMVSGVEADEALPATSVATAVTDRDPSASAAVVHENAPVPSAVHELPEDTPSTSS